MSIDKPNTGSAPRRRWPAAIGIGALIVAVGTGGFAIGAGSAAFGAGMAWRGGWSQGAKLAMVQYRVRAALDTVGATAEQEAQVHDIVAKTAVTLEQNGFDRDAVRKQMLDLLRAPHVDRAAIEKLRADQVAKLDTLSKTVVGGLVDAAQQLSPEQRGRLADRVAEFAQHRRWGRPGERPFDEGVTPGMEDHAPAAKPDAATPNADTPDHG